MRGDLESLFVCVFFDSRGRSMGVKKHYAQEASGIAVKLRMSPISPGRGGAHWHAKGRT